MRKWEVGCFLWLDGGVRVGWCCAGRDGQGVCPEQDDAPGTVAGSIQARPTEGQLRSYVRYEVIETACGETTLNTEI